jgi:hypothetical protein
LNNTGNKKKATLAPGQFAQIRDVLAREEDLLAAGPNRGKVFVVFLELSS